MSTTKEVFSLKVKEMFYHVEEAISGACTVFFLTDDNYFKANVGGCMWGRSYPEKASIPFEFEEGFEQFIDSALANKVCGGLVPLTEDASKKLEARGLKKISEDPVIYFK